MISGFNRYFTGFSLFFLVFLTFSLKAHNPSETYTDLTYKNGQLTITMELPWSIAAAVKKANPNLGQVSNNAFLDLAVHYIKNHFKVIKDGESIPIEGPVKVPEEFSHSATLIFSCPVQQLEGLRIENTIMFNFSTKEKNYHRVIFADGSSHKFVTSPTARSFIISDKTEEAGLGTSYLILALYLIVVIGIIVWNMYKKR